MAEVGNEFTTQLDIERCKTAFIVASRHSRGVLAKLSSSISKVSGNDNGGFFTPEFSSPFGFGDDGQPDFSVGVWIERFSGGLHGAGYCVQMHVWDKGEFRKINLFAPHGITEVYKPRQLIRKFTEAFHEADPNVPLY